MRASQKAARSARLLAAAGGLGVAAGMTIAGVALATPAQAATSSPLTYNCVVPAANYSFVDPWTVSVDTDYPTSVVAGAAISTSHFNASITAGDDAVALLRGAGVPSLSGSVSFSYAVAGDVASAGDHTADLTIDATPVPASGPLTAVAAGGVNDETAGATAGTATVTAGDFTVTVDAGSGITVGISCSLAGGQDATLASVQVTAAPDTTTTTSTPTDTGTSTATGTSTVTATGTGTSVTTGPPIVTDGPSSGDSNTGVLAGAGMAAVGAGLLTAGARRRMRGSRR